MNFDLVASWGHLLLLVVAIAAMAMFLAYPLWHTYPDDRGDGHALVLLPPPRLPEMWRALALIVFFAAFTVVYHSIRGPLSPDTLYAQALTRLTETVVSAPAQVDGYLAGFTLGLRFLVVGTVVALAVVGRGNLARRGLLVLQGLWFVVMMLLVDALLCVVQVVTGWPVGPTTLLGNFVVVLLAFLILSRVLFTTYALPKPTADPFVPRPRLNDTLTIIALTFASMAICAALMLLIYREANPEFRPALALVFPVPLAEGSIVLRTSMLAMMELVSRPPEPAVDPIRPPVNIIIPAYNEEEVIAETLRAIDVAAGRYDAPVHVILVNDGSKDRTREVALETIAGFRHATARIYDGRHGGKSEALNAGLKETTHELVVRIDADTLIDEWSLYYMERWFKDPEIGLVEAMMLPRWRRSPFPHMRLFEELKQFGFNHRTMQSVDGVNVVPGVFTAFRRTAGLQLGGFTVGMNGEDGDFTMRMSRLGYRSVLDPKVIVREDVPPTYPEIREQRVRWSRATLHNNSRHGPYRGGFATPKVWFSLTQKAFERTFSPARLMLPFFLLLTALFEGTYRTVVLIFLGGWVVYTAAFMALEVVLAYGYRQLRHVGWVLMWPLWQECLTLFSTEAWLSLPARPAGVHGARPELVTEAVVH